MLVITMDSVRKKMVAKTSYPLCVPSKSIGRQQMKKKKRKKKKGTYPTHWLLFEWLDVAIAYLTAAVSTAPDWPPRSQGQI